MKKKPRFFCDNCSYEVGSNVKACPYCGRFFASVRCPVCDYSGPDKIFQNGCPLCGYSASSENKTAKIAPPRVRKKKPARAAPQLALTYILSFIALIVLVAILSWLITR